MGIPFLLRRLKEGGCTTPQVVGRIDDKIHTRAIIDGPGFAHYVLHTLELNQSADSTIGTRVGYVACATEAVKWLQELEGYGFKM